MKYLRTLLLNIDATWGGIIYGAPAGIYISTWVGFKHKGSVSEKVIDWLMGKDHCQLSVISQIELVRKYYNKRLVE